ncbi:hypothetical protein LGQ02_12930 [Bacillus shivajii]|uniref:hypothetical protein n=1 Tax=Bacillus shivajii TaxID=1983719 RepID=UPI001CFAFC0C|nr:hypothetical protein [Bacillus shivajii]UCZ51765.1 hypothetical protein LGQ02_12930 [Bacillus shivajii]
MQKFTLSTFWFVFFLAFLIIDMEKMNVSAALSDIEEGKDEVLTALENSDETENESNNEVYHDESNNKEEQNVATEIINEAKTIVNTTKENNLDDEEKDQNRSKLTSNIKNKSVQLNEKIETIPTSTINEVNNTLKNKKEKAKDVLEKSPIEETELVKQTRDMLENMTTFNGDDPEHQEELHKDDTKRSFLSNTIEEQMEDILKKEQVDLVRRVDDSENNKEERRAPVDGTVPTQHSPIIPGKTNTTVSVTLEGILDSTIISDNGLLYLTTGQKSFYDQWVNAPPLPPPQFTPHL